MGSSTSKITSASLSPLKSATLTNAARKYPSHSPASSTTTGTKTLSGSPSRGPQVHLQAKASFCKDPSIVCDASDPDLSLAARLQQLGPVQPQPTQSNSSTFNSDSASSSSLQQSCSTSSQAAFTISNPTANLLAARFRLAEEAEREFESIGRRGAEGRTFLDVVTLRQAITMRARGMRVDEIEQTLELRSGVVSRLGRREIVSVTGMD